MSTHEEPTWFWDLLIDQPEGASEFLERNPLWRLEEGIPRSPSVATKEQQQTSDTFGYKWKKRETFEDFAKTFTPKWLKEKYGAFSSLDFLTEHGSRPIVLDAGCGAGMSGASFFGKRLNKIRYVGADISTSVDVARERFGELGAQVGLIQCDLNEIPIPPGTVDVIFSEGVLHHTDDTFESFRSLASLLKIGGRILFYVYRVKGPIREYTDDFIREKVGSLSPDEAWDQLMAITRLGVALGELSATVNIPEEIPLLGISAGPIDIQRFFYWHVLKAFYRPEMTLDEMNHINFDWFVPSNARRHTAEEVRRWCTGLGFEVEHEQIEDAGITIVARRKG